MNWKRWGVLLLAAWYCQLSTQFLHQAMLWFPPKPAVEADELSDYPCAHHHCGCNNATECRLHCCCIPKWREEQLTAARTAKTIPPPHVSWWVFAQCDSGHQDPFTSSSKFEPHVLAAADPFILASAPMPHASAIDPEKPVTFGSPPEKVPI